MSRSTRTEALPDLLQFVSLGPVGSGTYLMLEALSASLDEAGLAAPPPISIAVGQDGGEAMLQVAAGGPGVLGACSPAYLTTPVVHGLSVTWRDLTPVARLVSDSYLLVASTGSAKSASDLLARPTTAVVPKAGGNTDIQAMLIGRATGHDVSVIVERNPASRRQALLSGAAHWTTGVHSDFAADLEAGVLDVLATFDTQPSATAPTLREQGIDVDFPLWRGVIGPGDLDASVVAAWTAALQVALTQQAWSHYVSQHRQTTAFLAAADFATMLAREDITYRRWLTDMDR